MKTAHKAIKSAVQQDFVREYSDPSVYSELQRLFVDEEELTRRVFCAKANPDIAEAVLENPDILSHILEFSSNPVVLYVSSGFARAALQKSAAAISFIWKLGSFRATFALEKQLKALVPLSLLRPMQPFKITFEDKPPKIATVANTLFLAYRSMLKDEGMHGADPYHRELTEASKTFLCNSVRATRIGRKAVVAECHTGISIQ